jgi:hypothetical protein
MVIRPLAEARAVISGWRAPTASFSPCFPVTDMRAALAHHEQLGFEVMAHGERAEWGWIRLGNASNH